MTTPHAKNGSNICLLFVIRYLEHSFMLFITSPLRKKNSGILINTIFRIIALSKPVVQNPNTWPISTINIANPLSESI